MANSLPVTGDVKLSVTVAEAQLVRIFDSLKPNQDVFVQLVCGYEDGTEKVVGKTEVCFRGNFHPKWNEDFLIDRDPSQGSRTLKFRVHIDHIWRNPVLCGEAEFAVDNLWTKATAGPQRVVVPLFKRGSERTGILRISVAKKVCGAHGHELQRSPMSGPELTTPASAAAAVGASASPPPPATRASAPPPLPATWAVAPGQMPRSPASTQCGTGGDMSRPGQPQPTPVMQRPALQAAEHRPNAANRVPHPPPQQQGCSGGTVFVPQTSQQSQTQQPQTQQQQTQQQPLQQQPLRVLRPESKSENFPQFSYPGPPALLAAQQAMEGGVCGGMPCGTGACPGAMVPSAGSGVYATGLSAQWWNSFISRG